MSGKSRRGVWASSFLTLGVGMAIASKFTGNTAVGGIGGGLIIAVFIALKLGDAKAARAKRKNAEKSPEPVPTLSPEPLPAPLPAALLPVGTSLVGVRIRHRNGISDVTEDLDTPTPRRTVAALDTHGRPELLCVIVDENGNVIEAAVHGSELAAAEAI